MVILTCQPQSSGCEKVEQNPLLFKRKNSNRNRAPSSKNTNKRIRNGAELLSPETCEETSSVLGDDDDNAHGKEDEDNEQIGSTVQNPRSLPSDASEKTKNKNKQQAKFLFSVKIGKTVDKQNFGKTRIRQKFRISFFSPIFVMLLKWR